MDELGRYFAVIASIISLLASVLLTFDALGSTRAVLALAGVGVLGGALSVVAVWLYGRKSIATYKEDASSARSSDPGPTPMDEGRLRDREYLNTQVIPAFLDAGLDRTRETFAELIDSMELSAAERERERVFLEQTYRDPALSRREKIQTIVEHFAPEPWLRPSGSHGAPSDG